MANFRGVYKFIGSVNSRRQIYNSIKSDGNGKFYLDIILWSLKAEGISEYANTTTSILKQAVEEITDDLRFQIEPQYSKSSLVGAAFWYLLGATSFYMSIDRWRHSRFFGND